MRNGSRIPVADERSGTMAMTLARRLRDGFRPAGIGLEIAIRHPARPATEPLRTTDPDAEPQELSH